jgi:hypothetical protein
MSAEELRAAAKLLRERAEAAFPGPWRSWREGRDHRGGDSFIETQGETDLTLNLATTDYGRDALGKWAASQDYIATMHPLVGLALADWLDEVADDRHPSLPAWVEDAALRMARAIVGTKDEGGAA